MSLTKNLIFYLIGFVIIITSFFLFSPFYAIHYTSDNAVQVLMVNDLRLPDDLYFWGQNRLGSFVPILAWVIKKIFGCSAMVAISFVQYLLLACTGFVFSRYINSSVLKVCLFLFLFFPLPYFPEIVYISHPYVTQFFFIALGVYLGEKYFIADKGKLLYLFFCFISLGLSVWGSELSGLFFVLFIAALSFYFIIKPEPVLQRIKKTWPDVLIFLIATGATILFISYAKKTATGVVYENTFSSWNDFKAGIIIHGEALLSILKDPLYNIWLTAYVILFIIVLVIIKIGILKHKTDFANEYVSIIKWVFLTNAFISFLLLYFIYWTKRNNYEYRYWGYSFISFVIFLVLYMDDPRLRRRFLNIGLVAILSLLQVVLSLKYALARESIYNNETPVAELQDVKKLGSCGILGNYWCTYNLASVNPDECIAAPKEGEYLRNLRQVNPLLKKEKIYLVRTSWFDSFPDSVYQYGTLLKKNGDPFKIRLDELCLYKRIKYGKKLKGTDMKNRNAIRMADSASVQINKDTIEFNDFVIYGPYDVLNEGKYKIRFFLKAVQGTAQGKFTLGVYGRWGSIVYDKLEVNSKDLMESKVYELKASVNDLTPAIEYGISMVGKCSFILEKIEVEQVE